MLGTLPITNRRYSRLKICATSAGRARADPTNTLVKLRNRPLSSSRSQRTRGAKRSGDKQRQSAGLGAALLSHSPFIILHSPPRGSDVALESHWGGFGGALVEL
jgi:hypothetical protein